MDGMKIETAQGRGVMDMRPLAQFYAEQALKWFEDPEHEKEYQEWMKERTGDSTCCTK